MIINKPFKTWIAWGCGLEDEPVEYSFATEAELIAFNEGVDAAEGWLDYEQFETEKDATDWWTQRQLEPTERDADGR